MLRRGGSTGAVLDLLGMLEPDRMIAIYLALPHDRRKVIRRCDGVWAYRVERAPEGIGAAEFFLELFNEMDSEPVPAELKEFRREHRRLLAGPPHDLSQEEMRMGITVTE